ncbi:MAG: DUF2062 domain-containing protein [Saprospiraceae bacterium]|nr:DUF2062 domain-containing protein [Saprospiraceae bacterium]
MHNPDYPSLFDRWKTCVVIPTYNNAGTLQQVIESVWAYTRHIIVINDGSTDDTTAILSDWADRIAVHHLPKNSGKGIALRKGFELAIARGYERAITIDSDGQHRASDLPRFLESLEKYPDALMVGARNMGQDNVPGASSFGHKFSNFWYQVMTGRQLPDTQSGYRLYPLKPLQGMRLFTTKYELEMETLVRLSWLDIPVLPIPIDVYYPPQGERITHFRKIPDFSRIFALNTLLVVIAIFYERPLAFLREFKKKSARDFIKTYVFDSNETNREITYAVMLGLFIGVSPFWGYQIMLVIFFCVLLKLNKVIALVAAHISIPPMIPFILYGSYKIGQLVLHGSFVADSVAFSKSMAFSDIKHHFFQYLVGSLALGIALAALAGLIMYPLLWLLRPQKQIANPDNSEAI